MGLFQIFPTAMQGGIFTKQKFYFCKLPVMEKPNAYQLLSISAAAKIIFRLADECQASGYKSSFVLCGVSGVQMP